MSTPGYLDWIRGWAARLAQAGLLERAVRDHPDREALLASDDLTARDRVLLQAAPPFRLETAAHGRVLVLEQTPGGLSGGGEVGSPSGGTVVASLPLAQAPETRP